MRQPTALRSHSIHLGESPPLAPSDCFGRDGLVEEVVRLAKNLEPVALIGAGGIGKTSIALTALHDNRIKERFGENRRFIRCDQFPASLPHFLARLSQVIGAGVENPEDLAPLRPFLSSNEMLIVLDNAESILDPKGTSAKEMYSVVRELCQSKATGICITSRIRTVPPRCKRPEIPTLSMEAACDIFYSIYGDGGRSRIISDLLKRLDFHALSITLLATTASHNAWDYNRLTEEWYAQRAQVLRTDYNESLAATIELSLDCPTFRSLGPSARDLIGVVAFFPQGIDEKNLDWLFPTISDRKNIFDKFCVLSLTHRSNGFVTMLAPIREYLCPKNSQLSPLLCTTRDLYFDRLLVDIDPDKSGFGETGWIVSEDVNVEYLLDVTASADPDGGYVWDACYHFLEHLYWHKPRQTALGSKIEALADDHSCKPKCLFELSALFGQVGNYGEQKRLLTHTLELARQHGDDFQVADTLQSLCSVNRLLRLHEEGIRQAKESMETFERIGNTKEQAISLTELAWLLNDDKQFDAAEEAASYAINLIPKTGQEYIACELHRVFGNIYRSKGERKKAIRHFKTAFDIASPSNWHDSLFWNHYDLAGLFYGEGELDDATFHIERAKSHAVDGAYELGEAMYLQATVWRRQRRLEEAGCEASHALEIFEKLGASNDVRSSRDLLQMIELEIGSQSPSFQGELPETLSHPTSADTHRLA